MKEIKKGKKGHTQEMTCVQNKMGTIQFCAAASLSMTLKIWQGHKKLKISPLNSLNNCNISSFCQARRMQWLCLPSPCAVYVLLFFVHPHLPPPTPIEKFTIVSSCLRFLGIDEFWALLLQRRFISTVTVTARAWLSPATHTQKQTGKL